MSQLSYLIEDPVVCLELQAADKSGALAEIAGALARQFPNLKKETLLNGALEREKLHSTGIGDGLAIPHCRLSDIHHIYLAVARSPKGIPFESSDGQPARLLVFLVGPVSAAADLLKALARISKVLKDPTARALLNKSSDPDRVREALDAPIRGE